MTKQEFLAALRKGLIGLPQEDIEERIIFYGEMIDDRTEEGMSEEAAVNAIGSVEQIVTQVKADIPLSKLVKEKVTPKRSLKTWEKVCVAVGSPIWVSLLIAFFAVVFAVYAAVWSVMVALWAIEFTLAACSVGLIASAVISLMKGNVPVMIVVIGGASVCAGFSILMHYACKGTLKGITFLSKKIYIGMKGLFVRKENAQ